MLPPAHCWSAGQRQLLNSAIIVYSAMQSCERTCREWQLVHVSAVGSNGHELSSGGSCGPCRKKALAGLRAAMVCRQRVLTSASHLAN